VRELTVCLDPVSAEDARRTGEAKRNEAMEGTNAVGLGVAFGVACPPLRGGRSVYTGYRVPSTEYRVPGTEY